MACTKTRIRANRGLFQPVIPVPTGITGWFFSFVAAGGIDVEAVEHHTASGTASLDRHIQQDLPLVRVSPRFLRTCTLSPNTSLTPYLISRGFCRRSRGFWLLPLLVIIQFLQIKRRLASNLFCCHMNPLMLKSIVKNASMLSLNEIVISDSQTRYMI